MEKGRNSETLDRKADSKKALKRSCLWDPEVKIWPSGIGNRHVWRRRAPAESSSAIAKPSRVCSLLRSHRMVFICSFSYRAQFLNEDGCFTLRTYKWLALTCQAWSLYFTRPIMNAIFLSKICIPPFLKSNDSNFFPSAHFLSVSFNSTCESDRRRDEKWKRAVD